MNHHELVDVATIRLSGLLTRDQKLFERSLDVPPLVDVTPDAEATVDNATTAGQHDVIVDTPIGTFEAEYMPWQWRGPEYPTVVYHHGSGEHPFEFDRFSSSSFRGLFVGHEADLLINVVGVRAPFHDRSHAEYARALGDLRNFVGMCASSAALFEAIRADVAERSDAPVVLAGTSLGGFAANLHRACFGTADQYVPLLAGAAFGQLFISSVYRHLVAESALRQPERLREVLDFEDQFRPVDADDCAPLLARYDRVVEYDVQRSCYEGMSVGVLEKGHITSVLAADALRTHLLDTVRESGGIERLDCSRSSLPTGRKPGCDLLVRTRGPNMDLSVGIIRNSNRIGVRTGTRLRHDIFHCCLRLVYDSVDSTGCSVEAL